MAEIREHYQQKAEKLVIRNQCFIHGEFCDSLDNSTYENICPIDGRKIVDVAEGNEQDINKAVESARASFDKGLWRKLKPRKKMEVLFKLAELIEENQEELALLETIDTGKPIRYSRMIDIHHCLSTVKFYAESIDKVYGQVPDAGADAVAIISREPIGVVACITPWNFPMMMAMWKVIPAIAAGNSVVLKPAEQTPLTALRLAELAKEAGFPDGIFNVVPGKGAVAGKALGLHDDVDCLSFTGSTDVAKLLLQYAGQSNMKRVSAETGGKSANIIFSDAYDVIFAAKQAAYAIFFNSGAMCVAGARLLVQEDTVDEVLTVLKKTAKQLTPGHPFDEQTRMGPIIDKTQSNKIASYIQLAKEDQLEIALGGNKVLEELGGHYIEPTIIVNVPVDHRIAQEEIFGPVVMIIPFKDEAEAVAIANQTKYGLNAGIWTRDIARAHRMSKAITAGTIWINNWEGSEYNAPFGGLKQSGFGGKDKSLYALDKYCNIKTTWIQIDGKGIA